MNDLLVRTVAQSLQAFLPVGAALAWSAAHRRDSSVRAIGYGLAACVPATLIAGRAFSTSAYQARWEALLAMAALAMIAWFVTARNKSGLALAAATLLATVRQTMEIGATLASAVELRSLDAIVPIVSGALLGIATCLLWQWCGRRLPIAALTAAVRAFAVAYTAQLLMYAFHESAEARFLPWSDVLHGATELYGPDGFYGRYTTFLVFAMSIAAPGVVLVRSCTAAARIRPLSRTRTRAAFAAGVVIAVACLVPLVTKSGDVTKAAPAARGTADSAPEMLAISSGPHLLFRHTGLDANYGRLTMAPLDRPDATRLATRLPCERVSFAAGHGICLQADRGVFTTYKAVLLDASLRPDGSIKLDGGPSRTRISPDGRVGAITVFLTGHAYGPSTASTRTTLVDLTTGDALGDLEQFQTWRDGRRFKAADFNFWGVTFSRDANVFYASLRTAGQTYLVRADLGLRKLTVLRENVECPSLSPDNRFLAFKKRIGPNPMAWRLHLLELATMTERIVASETRYIDDQVEWLDNDHILYAVSRPSGATTDTWIAPIDGLTAPRVFVSAAESPIVVR
jgi:hypothetical protein